MDATIVPEVQVADAVRIPDAQAMSLTGNTQQDLQNIAKELGVQLDANGNIAEAQPAPAQVDRPQEPPAPTGQPPAQPQAAEAVAVPEKFQNADGTVNTERLEKSTTAINEAIAKYKAKEREFQQLQNKVNNTPQTQIQANVQMSPLEIQIANDLLSESTAQGAPLVQGQAIAQARVMAKALEAKFSAELDATSDLRRRIEDSERSRELQGLINDDPQLVSPEMVERLWTIRQENPYLNRAPEPWKAAYMFHVATQSRGAQVKTPTPTGLTAKAPPTPVGPVSRVGQSVNVGDMNSVKTLTDEQIKAELKKIYPTFRG